MNTEYHIYTLEFDLYAALNWRADLVVKHNVQVTLEWIRVTGNSVILNVDIRTELCLLIFESKFTSKFSVLHQLEDYLHCGFVVCVILLLLNVTV